MSFFDRFRDRSKFPTEALMLIIGISLLLGGCLVLLNENEISNRVSDLEERIVRISQSIDEHEEITREGNTQSTPTKDQSETNVNEQTNSGEKVTDFETEGSTNTQERPAPTEGSFIEVLTPTHDAVLTQEPAVFKGRVSPNTRKIVVNALVVSKTGKTYNAIYTIKDFQLGDEEFTYSSQTEWKNLTEGTNNYHFTAYFDDGSTRSTSVTVYYEPEDV